MTISVVEFVEVIRTHETVWQGLTEARDGDVVIGHAEVTSSLDAIGSTSSADEHLGYKRNNIKKTGPLQIKTSDAKRLW